MMLKFARTTRVTDALPVLTPVRKPSDVADIDYSPVLLLPARLDRSITGAPDFAGDCEFGFVCYSEELMQEDGSFIDRFYTADEVSLQVVSCVAKGFIDGSPMHTCVGVALGWLSALALVQPEQAACGLELLQSMLSSFITSPVPDQPVHYYVAPGCYFNAGRYVLAYKYCVDPVRRIWGFAYHYGRRTGDLVTFARYADAVRLADRLNTDLRWSAAVSR